MTAFRLISLPVHGALELGVGLATMAAPFVLGFGPAGLIAGVLVGALIVGMALSTEPGERGSMSVATHFAFDRGLVIGLLGAAVVFGAVADRAAALFFTLAALALLALSLSTRYTAPA